MVAEPEEILFDSTATSVSVVDVSLDRVRYLRARRDMLGSSEHCAVKQASSWRNGSARSSTTRSTRGRCGRRRSDFLLAKLLLPVKVAAGSE